MNWDDIIRIVLLVMYAIAFIRGVMIIRSGTVRRFAERCIIRVTTILSLGWTVYSSVVVISFFGSDSRSHALVTNLGRTWHVPTAMSLILIQYLIMRGRGRV